MGVWGTWKSGCQIGVVNVEIQSDRSLGLFAKKLTNEKERCFIDKSDRKCLGKLMNSLCVTVHVSVHVVYVGVRVRARDKLLFSNLATIRQRHATVCLNGELYSDCLPFILLTLYIVRY